MPSSFYIPILLAGMIITGSSNSLWSKWQDMQCVENCSDPNPGNHVLYEQPVWQTLQMFLGEMLCFLPVIYTWLRARKTTAPVFLEEDEHPPAKIEDTFEELRGSKLLLLWLPAACDLTGTTLMNVGLLYTPVSIYQMTRGALVLFVGTLSVIFLHRRLWLYQWVSLLTVMAGISLVGYSGSLIKDVVHSTLRLSGNDPSDEPEVTKVLVGQISFPIAFYGSLYSLFKGVFFILFAQVFTATQFVVEEKIMARYSVAPLVAVGYEGLFGALTIVMCMPILAMPSIASSSPFFDLPRGWYQMVNTPSVLRSGIAIAISISLFNYFGLSVTRHVSATARSLTDTCRTLSIWLVSLGLGWEKLLFPISLLQVLGFSFLVYGTFLFNGLVNPPSFLNPPLVLEETVGGEAEEGEALLSSQHLDDTAALPVDLGQSGYDVLPNDVRVHAQGVSSAED
ncbi:hypothetical protein DEU56DRAFT_906070 [Suillus clintonianus]|uniref:uncharacterized protein n=1 Tax=Suillus clintonianus TaxID=1904413 RepID=UPI001B85F4EA|nr:uncharacterized protein DEU56DRAFT_906070 [Suillus clintonianus]KAG2157426.1 hypothetical protein DEU56DRAFT_906070 [Suillus clintonianus]